MKRSRFFPLRCLVFIVLLSWLAGPPASQPVSARATADDPLHVYLPLISRSLAPPAQTVRLVFIHHSTGENWLADDYGGLGMALAQNNYFVSDTNYGWGPDAIGDRTDIPNWPEWFRGPDTPTYMAALYAESEQHASYTRLPTNPGGENQIVMFKSCFPNSLLEGNPDDPPAPGDGLTVSNAKYIYNDLLNYFSTRPDKLFVVITAPPVQDPTYAANARAFNNWLYNDWLSENNYPYQNVAVFDFYNVLTHPDNHHRFAYGEEQHVIANESNTLYYPSDDDHPNPAGSQKATQEFLPLLNYFYERWKASAPPPSDTGAPVTPPASLAVSLPGEGLIDDFESGPPAGTGDGWYFNWDQATQTKITCGPQKGNAYAGEAALQIDFDIAANSWATCVLFYDQPVDWSAAQGLSIYVHALQPGVSFDIYVYLPVADDYETYYHSYESTTEMANGWVQLAIPWEALRRAEWESNSGATVDPSRVAGFGFGLGAPPEAGTVSQLWADEIRLLSEIEAPPAGSAPASDLVDDFEAGLPPGSSEGWRPYWDETVQTQATCGSQGEQVHDGTSALQIDLAIPAGSWQTCAFFYDESIDWSATQGLSFYVHASAAGLGFDVDAYQLGIADEETYYRSYQTTPEMVDGWVLVEIPWSDLRRAEWETGGGQTLDLTRISGLAFGFGAPDDSPLEGQMWVDEIRLLGPEQIKPPSGSPKPTTEAAAPIAPPLTSPFPTRQPTQPAPAASKDSGLPCPGSLGLAALVGLVALNQAARRISSL